MIGYFLLCTTLYLTIEYFYGELIQSYLSLEDKKKSKLRNQFNESQTSENWKKYKQQRNKGPSILKGTKINYFNNLNPKFITDNKEFYNSKAMTTVVLSEKGKIIKNC